MVKLEKKGITIIRNGVHIPKDYMKEEVGRYGKDRIQFIEGMRGLFCLSVVNAHIVGFLFPQVADSKIWTIFVLHTPLFIFVSAGVGVSYFFFVSGFGTLFFEIKSKMLLDYRLFFICLVKRIMRLLPIIFISDTMCAILMRLGLYYSVPGFEVGGYHRFERYFDSSRGLARICRDVFYDIPITGKITFLSPFWTIRWDYLAMVMIMAFHIITRKIDMRVRTTVIICCAILFSVFKITDAGTYISAFLFGYIVFMLIIGRNQGKIAEIRDKKNRYAGFVFALIMSILIVEWRFSDINIYIDYTFCSALGFTVLVPYLLNNERDLLRIIFESKPMVFLGRLSFAIYGLHWMVFSSIGCYLVNKTETMGITKVLGIYFVCLTVTISLSGVVSEINQFIQNKFVNRFIATIFTTICDNKNRSGN